MASAESVEMGSIVAPAAVAEVHEADVADPGAVEAIKQVQRETQSGKYGSVSTKPVTRTPEEGGPALSGTSGGGPGEIPETTWIDLEMVDQDDKPVSGERYVVTDSQGRVARGTLDEKGKAHITGVAPGSCTIEFPGVDGRGWEPA
ncbi:MAG: hypothetical protein SFY69_08460 [Planctomycetota bacterium]|nr:hypothetical protein [Planctomycetota bacterium]